MEDVHSNFKMIDSMCKKKEDKDPWLLLLGLSYERLSVPLSRFVALSFA